jgi:hypothetical protein
MLFAVASARRASDPFTAHFLQKPTFGNAGCQVKVELLYVPDCAHYPSAVQQLREVLWGEGIRAEINEVIVRDTKAAEEYRFRGSPTIRINGRDIAGESHSPLSFVLACRIYSGTKEAGVPSLEMMQRAVSAARTGEKT